MTNFFQTTPQWQSAYPGASVGVLAMSGLLNPENHPGLDARKEAVEAELRARFAGLDRAAIVALPVLQAYDRYYSQFKKTYHVQLQLESVAFKGKSIPRVAGLVEAMFMAELKNQLLTAGHDLDALKLPAFISVADGSEHYNLLRGQEQSLKAGDMFIADRAGIISSIIYGPDQRTPITPATRRALFTVYAPPGIPPQVVADHLNEIRDNASLLSDEAKVEWMQVISS